MTPRYECDGCGACCRGLLIVEADYLDVLREPRLLDADVTGRRTTVAQLAEDDGRCILLAANRPCRFLSPEGRCTLYPTRPNVCVEMQAGAEQCQQVRQQCGLPPLQPVQPTETHPHDIPTTT
jgi:Fe-S-cluster containining protein